jgi:FkbM family methyltransferase
LRNTFGFYPRVIYDIGAHEGSWTSDCKKIYKESSYYQFEADTDKKLFLKEYPSFFEVLGDTDGKEVEYFKIKSQYTTGNSIFRENSHHFNEEGKYYTEKRKLRKLDSIVKENSIPLPDFIKLDTQGSELLILEGAAECMKYAEIVLLEVSIHEYNKNAPLIADVLSFMKERDFLMFDIVDNHYINGALAQIDIVFCRSSSRFLIRSF